MACLGDRDIDVEPALIVMEVHADAQGLLEIEWASIVEDRGRITIP
jgi:hypothetical protein